MSAIFIILVFPVTLLYLKTANIRAQEKDYRLPGLLWVLLTVAFEFIFGRYVFGNSWGLLVHDYNLLEGRVWSLVLVSMLIAPWTLNRFVLKK